MLDYKALIDKYYADNTSLREILLIHSRMVTEKALACACSHPELKLNMEFLEESAWLHDIGVFLTDAPSIHCHGKKHYLCHGLLGAELLRREGLSKHARVAERHTGAGLTKEQIISRNLPLPHQDFLPETLEEQLICYADKFYSKTRPMEEKTFERVVAGLEPFGHGGVERFMEWHRMFSC